MDEKVFSTLNRHGFKFEKKFGQNFITDTNLLKAIVADSGINNETSVLEIGTGAGTLTAEICKVAKRVVSYEIDKNLMPALSELLGGIDNLTLINQDILKVNMQDIDNEFPEGFSVVANLPYYITTPIILAFLENSKNIKSMTIMVQKEVAERLCAKAGSKDYGSITVAVDYVGGAKIMRIVSRKLFTPEPNVDSAIVRIDIDRQLKKSSSPELFYKVYRSAFAMRRKTLVNNLGTIINTDRAKIVSAITSIGFPADVRGERLTANDFVKLTDELLKIN